jgi:hypothetical protein
VVLALAAVLVGPYPLTPAEIAAAVLHRLVDDPAASATVDMVLFGVRLPPWLGTRWLL